MQKTNLLAQDPFGNAMPGAVVTVYVFGSMSLASLFADDEVTALPNPGFTDKRGMIGFKCADGTQTRVVFSDDSADPPYEVELTCVTFGGGGGGGGSVDSVNGRTGTVTLVGTDIPAMVGRGIGHARGTVPDPGTGGSDTDYLGRDGGWHAASGGGGGSVSVAIIQDQKSNGTNGGTSISGAYATRDLNTVVADPSSIIASLTSNEFELAAGTYLIEASAPCYNSGQFKTRLKDVTNAAVVGVGTEEYCGTSPTGANARSHLRAIVTPGANTKYCIEQRSDSSNANNGWGVCSTFAGEVEVYTQVVVTKIA